MLPGDGGPFGPPKAYHIPFRPIANPVAAARARERRRKMFALTKAAFPDLRVPIPLVSVRADETSPFPMPFLSALILRSSHAPKTMTPAPIFLIRRACGILVLRLPMILARIV